MAKPKKGEDTKKQGVRATAFLSADLFKGFDTPQRGSYQTYRKMRRNPTIALARAISNSFIKTSVYEVKTIDGVDEKIKQFIITELERLWPKLINNLLYAFDYGWVPFEKVWEVNADGRWVYQYLKPLLVDLTKPLIDKDTGRLIGLMNKGVKLDLTKTLIYTYDSEAGNVFGRSKYENIRTTAWLHWTQISERRGQYARKIAGVTPIIMYPEGESRDESGATKANFDMAKMVLSKLGEGKGVTMPNMMSSFAGDLSRSGVNLDELKAWHIEFLEPKGNHNRGFTDTIRHLESLLMRGMLVPERAAIEGTFGTKAESDTQTKTGDKIWELVFAEILDVVNSDVINPLLMYNFGEEDTVFLEAGALDFETKEFLRGIIKEVLTAPGNVDLLQGWVDIDNLLVATKIPRSLKPIIHDHDKEVVRDEKSE